MVTVHCSPGIKLTFGVITCVLPPLVLAKVALLCCPLAQVMSNHGSTTLTGSVKVIVILASRGAFAPLLRGSVPNTEGPNSTMVAVRRGLGAPVIKSAELLSVSVAPSFLRNRAVVLLLGPTAFAVSEQSALPYPTKSWMFTSPIGQLPSSGSKSLTSASLPEELLMLISLVMFAAGSGAPVAPPEPSAIK